MIYPVTIFNRMKRKSSIPLKRVKLAHDLNNRYSRPLLALLGEQRNARLKPMNQSDQPR
jgi:hypothetical protein